MDQDALDEIADLLRQADRLLDHSRSRDAQIDFDFWNIQVASWLKVYVSHSASAKWRALAYPRFLPPPTIVDGELSTSVWTEEHIDIYRRAIQIRKEWLADKIENLEQTSIPSTHTNVIKTDSKRIFVVHGHDEGPRETVARFLEKIGFEAIILHERPNRGRSIIAKFREEAAGIGFAVVLMTPDDFGGKVGAEAKTRARQNVVFELGFFIGALGPERVAALVKGEVEKPSDFDGVVYISLDHGHWKIELAKELKAAGYEIDFNAVMDP